MKPLFALCVITVLIPGSLAAVDLTGDDNEAAGNCEDLGLVSCFLPFVAFAMSDEAQSFTPAKSNGTVTKQQVDLVCSLAQPAAQCFKEFVGRCVPQNYTDVHDSASGTIQLLELCKDPNLHSKAKKVVECHTKLEATHKRCAKRMEGAVPKDVDAGNPTSLLRRTNALRDVCCHLKKYENCSNPDVKTRCSAEAVTLNQEFYEKVYRAYKCSQYLNACPV